MSEFFERRQRARAAIAQADERIERACRLRGMSIEELVEAPDEDVSTAYLQVSAVRLAELLERSER